MQNHKLSKLLSAIILIVLTGASLSWPTKIRAADNLIPNPALENGSTSPNNWKKGSWGANTTAFTYPVAGQNDAKAAKVEITSYTDGDAKWYFDDVAVTPGSTYIFSDFYKSTAETEAVARYTTNTGAEEYILIGSIPASNDWRQFSAKLTVPAGMNKLTIFHLIERTGTLTIDNVSLLSGQAPPSNNPPPPPSSSPTPPPPPPTQSGESFDKGYVSLTFDDGWTSQYDIARPMLNETGIKAGFYIVTSRSAQISPTVNAINNPSLETANGAVPQSWQKNAWGTNVSVFKYPVTGNEGAKAAQVTINSYSSGDAKWYFDDVTVTPNTTYTFKDSYNSTTSSKIVARYKLNNNSFVYTDLASLAKTNAWQNYNGNFTTPGNATSVTIFHLIQSKGSLTVDNYSLLGPEEGTSPQQEPNYMTPQQVLQLQQDGHEIGAHTRTHAELTSQSPDALKNEVAGSRADLLSLGINQVDTFVYPFGSYDDNVIQAVKNAGFIGARSVDEGYGKRTDDKYKLLVQNVVADLPLDEIKNRIDTAIQTKTWLNLVFHQQGYDPEAIYGNTPEVMRGIVNYIRESGIKVITMRQGILLME